MKILLLWRYYKKYLFDFYAKHPQVSTLGFSEHRGEIFNDHFGWPAEITNYINKQGIGAELIIVNAEMLQKQWAAENKCNGYSEADWERQIVFAQIKRFKPDIVWIGALFNYCGAFVKSILPYCKKVIIWVGSPFLETIDSTGISVLLTENPNTFRRIHDRFERIIVTKPGFNENILPEINAVEKNIDVSFIGGISHLHAKRARILASLIQHNIDIKVFADIRNTCQPCSDKRYNDDVAIIEAVNKGPVFGLDMYRTMSASRITLNVHIDNAQQNAGNMRMFEATGAGACLLTEHANNIDELFVPHEEILTYHDEAETVAILKEKLAKRDEVASIAHAGQRKTLSQYTISRMFEEIKQAFDV